MWFLSVMQYIHAYLYGLLLGRNEKYLFEEFLSFITPSHTVSFDWFLSGLEWILKFEFCLLKLLIFYQKLLWNIRSRLNYSTFWVLSLYLHMLDQNLHFLCKKLQFWSKIFIYRLKNSKCGRVKPRSDIP